MEELSLGFPLIKDCGSKARKKALVNGEVAFKRYIFWTSLFQIQDNFVFFVQGLRRMSYSDFTIAHFRLQSI